jgi:hypothetical protein
MRLNLYKPETDIEQTWWWNFKQSLAKDAWPGTVLKQMYNASLVFNTVYARPYIDFADEKDATIFLLRYA